MTTDPDAIRPDRLAAAVANADLPTHEPGIEAKVSQLDEESEMLWREGLPSNAIILAPSVEATPMRHPEHAWGMLVLAVDLVSDADPDLAGKVVLFVGCWLSDPPFPTACDGDLVLVLTAPDDESPLDDRVDVEMLLAHGDRWERVGEWPDLDARWPWTVALTAAAIMGLHTEATEVTLPHSSPAPPTARHWSGWGGNVGIADLITAGLVQPGEEFVWDRPGLGVRHIARVQPDGALLLSDGRAFINPSGAIAALGSKHRSGWKTWRRATDGRYLGDLRAELRAQLEFRLNRSAVSP